MHELSIALSILEIAADEAERLEARTVHSVRLKPGALSGVVKEALLSAFDLAREQTILASTRLQIEEIPTVIHCQPCNRDVTLGSIQNFCCPDCGTPSSDIVSGRELEITGLEIEP